MSMRYSAQDRSGAVHANRTVQRALDRGGFARFRHNRKNASGGKQGGNRQRDRVGGTFVHTAKVTFANLLAAGRLGKLHGFDPDRIGEIGEGWIVEREMSIFANPERAQIGGMGAQQLRVIATGSLAILALTLYGIERPGRDLAKNVLA